MRTARAHPEISRVACKIRRAAIAHLDFPDDFNIRVGLLSPFSRQFIVGIIRNLYRRQRLLGHCYQ